MLLPFVASLSAVTPLAPSVAHRMTDWYVDVNAPGCVTGNGSQSAPFCDINDALAVAASGDTIVVAPGTYFERLDLSVDLVLEGTGGAASTIVDGSGMGRVVYIRPGVRATLEGLTIRNGFVLGSTPLVRGGGILNEGDLTIRDSVVADNRLRGNPSGRGAGIASTGELTLIGTVVTDNELDSTGSGGIGSAVQGGGGIAVTGLAAILSSEIEGNTAVGLGGGLGVFQSGGVVLRNSTVSGNSTTGEGGGVGTDGFQTSVDVQSSTVRGNLAGRGGGVSADVGTQLTIVGSTISGNTVAGSMFSSNAAGVFAYETTLELRNSTISGNTTSFAPAAPGLFTNSYYDASVTLESVTVTNNDGSGWHHLGAYAGFVEPVVHNSLLAANTGTDVVVTHPGGIQSGGFNLIGHVGGLTGGGSFTHGVNGDLVGTAAAPLDPLLGPLTDNGGATQTHALMAASPAIDAGDPVTFEPTDQRGLPRPAGFADMGAFERDPGGPIPGCPPVPNSTGAAGAIAATGTTSLTANDFGLSASSLPLSAFGFFLTSRSSGSVLPANSMGRLCLSGAIGRFVGPGQVLSSGATGSFSLALDLALHPTPTGLVQVLPGETWFFQAWHRDAVMGSATSNFTTGIAATFR